MQETWVQSLGWEDRLEKSMATHVNSLAWRIPWTEGPGKLQYMGLQRDRHNWATNNTIQYLVVSDSVRPRRWQPTRFPIPGILQARTLEWVAISFSNAWKWKVKVKSLSLVWLLGTPWTGAHQVPPSMGFSRQECWSGVPLPSPTIQYSTPREAHWPRRRTSWETAHWGRRSRTTLRFPRHREMRAFVSCMA